MLAGCSRCCEAVREVRTATAPGEDPARALLAAALSVATGQEGELGVARIRAAGDVRPAGVHPSLGASHPWGLGVVPAGGEGPLPARGAFDVRLDARPSTLVNLRAARDAESEASGTYGVLRHHGELPSPGRLSNRGHPTVAQVARPTLPAGAAVAALQAVAGQLSAAARRGGALCFSSRSEAIDLKSRMREIRTSGSVGGQGAHAPWSTRRPIQCSVELASCQAPMAKVERGRRADLADRWPSSSVQGPNQHFPMPQAVRPSVDSCAAARRVVRELPPHHPLASRWRSP